MRRADNALSLVVLGTSGHARELLMIADSVGIHSILGCVGPDHPAESAILPVPRLGDDDWLLTADSSVLYAIGVGSSPRREQIDQQLRATKLAAATLVHPAAVVGPRVQLDEGSTIWPGAVLTADITVGRHVHVNTNAAIGHDATLENYCSIYPGSTVGGRTRIGHAATIGAGATVIDDIRIGRRVVVGAGAVVIRDVPDDVVVVGNPARPLNSDFHRATESTPLMRANRD
jgi:sugar O-acyltransferase (sialic acid O-acetyltransferase NeuD family)